jgi:NitT/TauT family transport system substrate-binding protein
MARLMRGGWSGRRGAAIAALVLTIAGALPLAGQGAVQAAMPVDNVTLAMGYIPNVQFAPFYVAAARGYYKAAHLNVTFNYGMAPDLLRQVGLGKYAFANADSDGVIAARASGIPVRYIAAQYQRFPTVVFALSASHITRAADLRGKTIGLPGLYGSSYVGLLHLLHEAGLTTKDVHLVSIGYTQPQSVARKQVQAAVGYAMNEPVALRAQGYAVSVIGLPDAAALVGSGLITSDGLLQRNPDLVRRFVQASLQGLRDTLQDPNAAFAVARPKLGPLDAAGLRLQRAVLQAALPYWHVTGVPLGYSTPAAWARLVAVMRQEGQLAAPVTPQTLYTNEFVR